MSEAFGREARRDWPVRMYRLGEEPGDDLSAVTTPAERLAMMWQLTLDAWTLSGATIEPRLPRHVACVVRGGR